MKKAVFSIATLSILLTSCVHSGDSYTMDPYVECNLIVDNTDPDAPAQTSTTQYDFTYNFSKNTVDIKTTDIIINNQRYSFETDPMEPKSSIITVEGLGSAEELKFSKSGATAVGSAASDLNGKLVWAYMTPRNTSLLNPDHGLTIGQRLDLSYKLSNNYSVQTFWSSALYRGVTVASDNGNTHTCETSDYITVINLEKKTAEVYIYNPKFSTDQAEDYPKLILVEGVTFLLSHDSYTLEASAPKTTILGKKDNQTAMVESEKYKVTDFTLHITSSDMTDAMISYKIDGKIVNFRGCSIMKARN